MDVILVPGLWLDASSWSAVVPSLERAGHRAHPLTLPGLESADADRSAIGLADHVAAVVAEIDAADAPVLLVGHSAGSGVVHAALDARVDRVAAAVFVGGFPTGAGQPIAGDFTPAGDDLAFPDWSEFEEADLVGLDDDARAGFRARAVPSPARLARDEQTLGDERRYDVPITLVCTEYTSAMLRDWVARDLRPVQEIPRFRTVHYVDLPTGHWPQFTRPDDLGRLLATLADAPRDAVVDEHGRVEPDPAADELATLTGFLDYQRATLAWKCSGLDAEALRATTAASSMTLGGLLKHMAYVEDSWFTHDLHDRPWPAPWADVDWKADRDWEWHSAADDSPVELFAMWQTSVQRSRASVADAVATADLGRPAQRGWPDGRAASLRWILCHMIEEYARHNGHADLLRESIDGETGE